MRFPPQRHEYHTAQVGWRLDLPSHHQAETLDLFDIDWGRIGLVLASVCSLEGRPRYRDGSGVRGSAISPGLRTFEVKFIADCALFSAIGSLW